ncbi:uncharacterized protein LOC123275122 [Cotesia glomerata]|uniref:uncharacterized protein LOC123275122 n=1 Tax=Cotesia glomerata TaxID=32391 RepID=UPI001D01147D|nr:uncharacterized protein LOC123275122 [Cotesia glomerata]
MSNIPKSSRYETSAPQWVDFEAMTPNAAPDDGYFDHFHYELESTPYLRQMQPLTPDDPAKKADRLQKVKASSLFTSINEPSVESSFIDDLNEMYISPIKLTSPSPKKQEPQVLKELSVDEVLNDVVKDLEITSITKKRRTPKLNKTACESTTTTPNPRQLRISRSINFNAMQKQTSVIGNQSEELKIIPKYSEAIPIDGETGNKAIQSLHINEEYKENINVKVPKIIVEHIKTPGKNVITSHYRTPSGRTAIKITTTPCRMNLQNTETPIRYSEAEDTYGINEQDDTMIAEEEDEEEEGEEDNDDVVEIIERQKSKSSEKHEEQKKLSSDKNITISSDDNYRSTGKRKLRLSKSLHHPSPSVFRPPPKKNIITPCSVKLERLLTPLKNKKLDNLHLFEGGIKDTMDIDDDLQAEIESVSQVPVKQVTTPATVNTEDEITEKQSQSSEDIDVNKLSTDLNNKSPEKLSSAATENSNNVSVNELDDDVFEPLEDFRKKLNYQDQQLFKVHYNRPANRQSTQAKLKVLTGTARRRSDQHQLSKANTKYVSLAEGVSTFHRSTPIRFHTVSTKVVKAKAGPVQKVQQAPKRTIPVSPAWHGRTRTRRPMPTQFELEKLNREKNKIRAKPVPKGILNAPKALKAVPKKPPTELKPFQLTGTRPVTTKPRSQSKPASVTCKSVASVSSSRATSSTSSASTSTVKAPLTRSNSQINRSILTINNDGAPEQQQVLHFSIPVAAQKQHNIVGARKTIPQPFSLEARNQEFLMKKQRKLEKLREEEDKKLKSQFHARPVPTVVKKPVKHEAKTEKVKKAPVPLKVKPFSFENRDKMLAKKKEEMCRKATEEAQKIKEFHAKPAPTFKPVTVRTTSKESIRSESRGGLEGKPRTAMRTVSVDRLERGNSSDKLRKGLGTRGLSAQNLRSRQDSFTSSNLVRKPIGSSSSSIKDGTRPDQQSNSSNAPSTSGMPVMKQQLTALPILHSDRRAQVRQEFEEKLKMKTERENALHRMEQQAKLIKEQAEINEIRKRAEIKARPMPVYKPLVIVKSEKPLTDPSSPAWTRAKH